MTRPRPICLNMENQHVHPVQPKINKIKMICVNLQGASIGNGCHKCVYFLFGQKSSEWCPWGGPWGIWGLNVLNKFLILSYSACLLFFMIILFWKNICLTCYIFLIFFHEGIEISMLLKIISIRSKKNTKTNKKGSRCPPRRQHRRRPWGGPRGIWASGIPQPRLAMPSTLMFLIFFVI